MESRQYERPQAAVVEFGRGDMGRYVTTSGDIDMSGDGTVVVNPGGPGDIGF